MSRRFDASEPELMDRPQPVSEELEQDLKNLVSLNRRFGSHRLLLSFARRWLKPGGVYRVLDLATGAGDLPRVLVSWARTQGIHITVDAVDFQGSTLAIAGALSPGFPEIQWREADIRSFSAPAPYDLVTCSLALHHFSKEDAVQILERCAALSGRWMLVSDLERSRFTTAAIWALTQFFYREPMTRCDARTSAERAFSCGEMKEMGRLAGLKGFKHGRFLFARQALWTERE